MDGPRDLTKYFAEDYFAARNRFLKLAGDAKWAIESHPIVATGPAGEPLFIDVASKPGTGAAANRTVIVSSGLHGVEGFLGSAVQCAALECLASFSSPRPRLGGEGQGRGGERSETLSTSAQPEFESNDRSPLSLTLSPGAGARGQDVDLPRMVFIHALNPYGFAWIRRCNEDNVDLNRNFPSPGNAYRGSPADYAKLSWLLNKKLPPSPWEPFRALALAAILRYGIPRLKRAIASGQYDYPLGLFYGGSGPCETTRFVQAQFESWIGEGRGEVLHLDFHTGLGASGEFQFLADVPPTPEQAERIRRLFGREVLAGPSSPVVAYQARGSIGEWCQTAADERNYQYLCVEFGTYPPVKVLTALRAENRAQHWDRPQTASYCWAKSLLREAFCPSSPQWRQTTAAQGLDLIMRAVTAK